MYSHSLQQAPPGLSRADRYSVQTGGMWQRGGFFMTCS